MLQMTLIEAYLVESSARTYSYVLVNVLGWTFVEIEFGSGMSKCHHSKVLELPEEDHNFYMND